MVQRNGVRGGIGGNHPSLDGKAALRRCRLLRLASESTQQQSERKKNAYPQDAPPQTVQKLFHNPVLKGHGLSHAA
jgi:hypothetical protein